MRNHTPTLIIMHDIPVFNCDALFHLLTLAKSKKPGDDLIGFQTEKNIGTDKDSYLNFLSEPSVLIFKVLKIQVSSTDL